MFKTIHIYYCKICGAEFPESYQSVLAQNPAPILPTGWVQFSDGYVCDKHDITIKEKPEEGS